MFEAKEGAIHSMGVSETPPLLPSGWYWDDATGRAEPFMAHLPSGVIERGVCLVCTKTPQTQFNFK